MKFLILLSSLFLSQFVYGQSFIGGGGAIPDNGTMIDFPIQVSGLANPLDTNYGLEKVCFSMTHPYVSDIQMLLISPSGKAVFLFGGVGWDGDNFQNTCLGGRNNPSIFNSSAPFTGTFSPSQSLGQQNNGQSANGIWKLRIWDTYPQDQGFLQSWSITFSNQPARIFNFSSTNLPLVLIDTRSQPIPDEPKLPARIKIMEHADGTRNFLTDSVQYNWLPVGIEQRGSSSANFPKKSYGFEFQNPAGDDTSFAVLGMPAQSDWILSANYSDKSFMRNTFAYDLARKMGWYASRTRYVEVVLNDEYQGIYVLMEKIKRDVNRVNISKLKPTDISGPNLSGGYIIKIDKTTGNDNEGFISSYPPKDHDNGEKIRFLYDYPKAEDLVPEQKAYIKAYVDSFETALNSPDFASANGYRRFAITPSFIDYFLINEWSKNVDGYRISTYLTKPKITQNGGKLIMGPVWDYDIAWRNADYCDAQVTSGWAYDIQSVCPGGDLQPPTWWTLLRTDPVFKNETKCRWLQLTNEIMPPAKRTVWIDSVKILLNEAQQRNFSYWPILGEYVWPNPQPIPTTYSGETVAFRNWLTQRTTWLNTNLGGSCVTENTDLISESEGFIFPNPVRSELEVTGWKPKANAPLVVFNSLGQKHSFNRHSNGKYNVSVLSPGLYWIRGENGKLLPFVKE